MRVARSTSYIVDAILKVLMAAISKPRQNQSGREESFHEVIAPSLSQHKPPILKAHRPSPLSSSSQGLYCIENPIMWCDNCLLLLPLRGGAIAWAILLGIYNLVGGILLLRYGQFLYFVYPEWYIYGGISMAIGGVAVLNILSLSNRSYIWTRVCHFLWPVLLVISGIRGVIMILQLNRGQDKIAWECQNGGQVWGTSLEDADTATVSMPGGICSTTFRSLFTAFIVGVLIDIGFQLYMFFLNWRFCRRLEHYRDFKGPDMRGYYTA